MSAQQFLTLLWKNFTLKYRRYFATVMEMAVPLLMTFVLMYLRKYASIDKYDQCYLREKHMDSMGPLLMVRDYFCTYNFTCYNEPQINWIRSDENELYTFLLNMSSVYSTFPKNNLSTPAVIDWMENNQFDLYKLHYGLQYVMRELNPLLLLFNMTQSDNSSLVKEGIDGLSSALCGSNINDVRSFITSFKRTNSQISRENQSCQSSLQKHWSSEINSVVGPILFGKIFYTPHSNFTDQLIRKANHSFVILDNLRLASIEWRLFFRTWIEKTLTNSTNTDNIRNVFINCSNSNNTDIELICRVSNTLLDLETIKSTIHILSSLFAQSEYFLNCVDLNKFVPLPSETDINNLDPELSQKAFAGIIFDPSFRYDTRDNATFLNYTIRISETRINPLYIFKGWYFSPLPQSREMQYYTSGFLMLQEAIDRAFSEMVTNSEDNNIGSSIQVMPSPCFVADYLIRSASTLIPVLLIISWSLTFTLLVKSIVYEKENRIKEFMLIMGLSSWIHWLAWFVTAIITVTVPITIMTLSFYYYKVFRFSSPWVIFFLLFSYNISLITQAFLFSVFFNRSNVAAIVSGLVYYLFFAPFVIIMDWGLSFRMNILTGLLSQISFCNAIYLVTFWEETNEGVHFGNLFRNVKQYWDYDVGHCIVMLWVNALMHVTITLYIEAVFPGQYGIPKKWYFFFTKQYWCSDKKVNHCNVYKNSQSLDEENDLKLIFEPVSDNLEVGISIRSLTKRFSINEPPAVDNLNLDFYKSHITAFLGQNGAGKTTTISILTGIFPPTSGTAYILNQDIRNETNSIRKVIGLCPQHNILYDHLTVEDHIHFYGRLKGMTFAGLKLTLPSILEDVGLTTKRNVLSSQLSGGMKRKLNVAIAFLGNSKIIFLDEPTTGVDPFSRRGIWDLLVKYRGPDKTIILTTHQMDEADYLSDRIAIISRGKLKYCGSSVFLKNQHGNRYYITLVKSPKAQAEDITDNELSSSGLAVFRFIKRHIRNAEFVSETRTQWIVVIPLDGLENYGFGGFFRNLDKSLEILNISSYGLSDTSLEQMFLKIAEDQSESDEIVSQNKLLVKYLEMIPGINDLTKQFKNKLPGNESGVIIDYNLLSGFSLLRQQLWAMQLKRFHNSKRDIKGLLFEVIFPVSIVLIFIALLRLEHKSDREQSMVIHPWLMVSEGPDMTLNTFYRKEQSDNKLMNTITDTYRTDLGESGIRCMNKSIYSLKDYQCVLTSSQTWTNTPRDRIPLRSPACDCKTTGYQTCSDSSSGGPTNSHRVMSTSDILHNLSGYNLSDHFMKNYEKYSQSLYGGYQFLLPNYFGLSCKLIGNGSLWTTLQNSVKTADSNTTHPKLANFLNYLQQFFKLSGLRTQFSRIWVNTQGYVSMPAYVNVFGNLLLRSSTKPSKDLQNYGIVVSNNPYSYSERGPFDELRGKYLLEVILSIFLLLALSIIPASFVLFLIEESASGAKKQQFVTGINIHVYWISNFIWDVLKYVVSVFLIITVLLSFNYQSYIGKKNCSAFLAILSGYGIAIIPHMYVFSFMISTPSVALVVLSIYNMVVGTITTLTTVILDTMIVDRSDSSDLKPINDFLKGIFLIFPQYGLGRGITDLSINYLKYKQSHDQLNYKPFDWDISGKIILSFIVQSVFSSNVICLIENGINHWTLFGKISQHDSICDEDVDVASERERVKSDINSDYVLKVLNLTKVYSQSSISISKCCNRSSNSSTDSESRIVAVNNICFGVKAGECFGLLGVNGAGKTTIFKMLTGEELITKGDVLINGKSIITNIAETHKNMGFCPQFDALHALLTCEEELYLYCRIRGIEPSLIKSTVDSAMNGLTLAPYAHNTTQTLSGGNMRKLSAAISFIGNPSVVFMDEPTSGMDAFARRFLWNKIRQLTKRGRTVILTSHNMEECEELCDRVAIMVNGTFQCIGSVQHLKSRFGDNYSVSIMLHRNCEETGERQTIKDIMKETFKNGIVFKDENFVTIQYKIDPSLYKLCSIFEFLENLKRTKQIFQYSVSQTTLDDIFINFAKKEKLLKLPDSNYNENDL